MGTYVDPGNENFKAARDAEVFVDVSELISFTSRVLNVRRNKLCVARPQRFGKTTSVDMLTAYYSCGCDSAELFQDLAAAEIPSFERHLNRYHVIRLDIGSMYGQSVCDSLNRPFRRYIQDEVLAELAPLFPDAVRPDDKGLARSIQEIHKLHPEVKFVFLIDDWDWLFRDPGTDSMVRRDYLGLLSGLLKGLDAEACVALAYLTGILPVPQYPEVAVSQTGLNNFMEYSMLHPRRMGKYTGFTLETAADLCGRFHMSLEEMQEWYGGYCIPGGETVFCPGAVVSALQEGACRNFWTDAAGCLDVQTCLNAEAAGLKETAAALLAGHSVQMDPARFQNDVNHMECADDVLGCLVHLGCLTFREEDSTVSIPNREMREVFAKAWK